MLLSSEFLTTLAVDSAVVALAAGMFFVKRNAFYGFRCKWTMLSDFTWRKSNNFAAVMLIAFAFASVPFAYCSNIPTIMTAGFILASVAPSLYYAHRLYNAEISARRGSGKIEK